MTIVTVPTMPKMRLYANVAPQCRSIFLAAILRVKNWKIGPNFANFLPSLPIVPKRGTLDFKTQKKMCGFNKSIFPLNKTFLLINWTHFFWNTFFFFGTQEEISKKKCFHFRTEGNFPFPRPDTNAGECPLKVSIHFISISIQVTWQSGIWYIDQLISLSIRAGRITPETYFQLLCRDMTENWKIICEQRRWHLLKYIKN